MRIIILILTLVFCQTSIANEKLQSIFSIGTTYSSNGEFNKAIKEFRKMLVIDPTLVRPRLELALNLYKSGEYESAKYHFIRVLSSNMSVNVRNNVNALLNKIKQELPIINFSINLVSDTNPNQESSASTVNIGGFEFSLGDVSQDKHQNGYQFIVNSKVPINSREKTFIKANLQHTDYPGKDNAQSYISTSIGKHYIFNDGSTLTPEAGLHNFIHKDNSLYSGKTLSLKYIKPIDKTSHTELTLNSLEMKYPEFNHLDGWRHTLSVMVTKIPTPDNRWDFQATYLTSNQKDKTSTFIQPGISLSSTQELSDGWTLGATVKLNKKTYQQVDPFFGKVREDNVTSAEVTILNSLLQIDGISPRLHIGRIKNDSNMDIYKYNSSYIKLEFSKEF